MMRNIASLPPDSVRCLETLEKQGKKDSRVRKRETANQEETRAASVVHQDCKVKQKGDGRNISKQE